jgi:acetoin utilization deacetylase AcuC-like enzyme
MQRITQAFSYLNVTASPRVAPPAQDADDAADAAGDSMLTPSSKRAQDRRPLKVMNGIVIPSLSAPGSAPRDAAAGPPSSDASADVDKWVAGAPPAQVLFRSQHDGRKRVSCVQEELDEEGRWAGNDPSCEVWAGGDRGDEMQAELLESMRNQFMPGSAVKSEPGYKGTPAKLKSLSGPTLVIFDQVFEKYQTYKGCQECSQRVTSIMGSQGIIRTGDHEGLTFEEHAQPASIADILRVHDWEYVSELQRRCANMSPEGLDFKCADPPGHPQDTSLSGMSYTTAATAAGAVCKAVDRVMSGECKNAFVAARPPGHHAGPSGLVFTDDGRPSLSQGFCLLNSVAIGAAYAKYNYRKEIARVAIIDFDVHNGDGTAAIVRGLQPHVATRRLGPVTSIQTPCFKPWVDANDSENVFFASLHLAAENFYPRNAGQDYYPGNSANSFELMSSGKESDNDPAYPNILNIPLHKTTNKAESAALFRSKVEEVLLPQLRAFAPELIMISAGFDGHFEDIKGNNGLSHLVEDDYEWITEQLCQVAAETAGGRVVSVLEGGYHVERKAPAPTPARNTRRQSSAVPKSDAKKDSTTRPGALALSVAAHVKALEAAAN